MEFLAVVLGVGGIATGAYMIIPAFKHWIDKLFNLNTPPKPDPAKDQPSKEMAEKLRKAEEESTAAQQRAETAEKRSAALDKEMGDVKAQAGALAGQKQTAEDKLKDSQQAAGAATARAETAEKQVAGLTQTVSGLQASVQQTAATNASLTTDLAGLKAANVDLNTQLKAAIGTVAEQKGKLAASDAQMAALATRAQELGDKEEAANKEKDRLEEERGRLAGKNKELADSLRGETTKKDAAEKAAGEAQLALEALKASGTATDQQLASAKRNVEQTAQDLATATQKIEKLNAAALDAANALKDLKQQLGVAVAAANTAKDEKESLGKDIEGLKAQVATLAQSVTNAEKSRDDAVAAAKAQQESTQAAEKAIKEKLDAANKELETLKTQVGELAQSNAGKDKEIETLNGALTTANAKADAAAKDAGHKDAAAKELTGQLDKAKEAERRDKAAFDQAVREKSDKQSELEAKLAVSIAAASALAAKLVQANADANQQQAAAKEAKEAAANLQSQLNALKTAKADGDQKAQTAQNDLQQQLAKKEATSRDLASQMAAMKDTATKDKAAAKALEEDLRGQLGEATQKLDGLQKQLQTATDAKATADSQLDTARKDATQKAKERDAETEKVNALKREIARLNEALRSQSNKVGWDVKASGYEGMHVPIGGTQKMQIVMSPPQDNIPDYSDPQKMIYQNKGRSGAVTFVLPPDIQWKDIEIVDTKQSITIDDWLDREGKPRAANNKKIVPWYAIKIKGEIKAAFPPTLGIRIVGHGFDTKQPLGDNTPLTDGEPIRDMIVQPPLRLRMSGSTYSDDDNDIDIQGLREDTYSNQGVVPDDKTIEAMKSRSGELPLVMLQKRVEIMKDIETRYKKVREPERGYLPPEPAPPKDNSPEATPQTANMQQLLEFGRMINAGMPFGSGFGSLPTIIAPLLQQKPQEPVPTK